MRPDVVAECKQSQMSPHGDKTRRNCSFRNDCRRTVRSGVRAAWLFDAVPDTLGAMIETNDSARHGRYPAR
jgi:hypothetical protein